MSNSSSTAMCAFSHRSGVNVVQEPHHVLGPSHSCMNGFGSPVLSWSEQHWHQHVDGLSYKHLSPKRRSDLRLPSSRGLPTLRHGRSDRTHPLHRSTGWSLAGLDRSAFERCERRTHILLWWIGRTGKELWQLPLPWRLALPHNEAPHPTIWLAQRCNSPEPDCHENSP